MFDTLRLCAVLLLIAPLVVGCSHVRGLAVTYQSLANRSTVDGFRVKKAQENVGEVNRQIEHLYEAQRLARDVRDKSAAERAAILRGRENYHDDDDESLAGEVVGAILEPIVSTVLASVTRTTSNVILTPFTYVGSLQNNGRNQSNNSDYQALVEAGRQIQALQRANSGEIVVPAAVVRPDSSTDLGAVNSSHIQPAEFSR